MTPLNPVRYQNTGEKVHLLSSANQSLFFRHTTNSTFSSAPRNIMASFFLQAVFGPRLYRIHKPNEAEKYYHSKYLEAFGDKIISSTHMILSFSKWASPFIILYFYRHGYYTSNMLVVAVRSLSGAAAVYLMALVIRGLGRYMDADYMDFQRSLTTAKSTPSRNNIQMLNYFDFEQWARPYDFSVVSTQKNARTIKSDKTNKTDINEKSLLQKIMDIPMLMLGYVFFNVMGRALVYPGSTWVVNKMNRSMLLSYRAKLVEEDGAVRARVETFDKNGIDTVFIDNRNKTLTGQTLVICCEGNCGYYEIGILCTPFEKGYSVLGWNHPGFGESSGHPCPKEEQNAIDSVIQYAIEGLGFLPGNIIIYSWSIGGYVATWAGMTYPDLKALIIDASFDHLLPLAITRLPAFMESFVTLCVHKFMNLNLAEQVVHYNGPIILIRRTHDEVITTSTQPDLLSNRGNHLLTHILTHRYPNIIKNDTLQEWLGYSGVQKATCLSELNYTECSLYLKELPNSFPIKEGIDLTNEMKRQMTIFLANKYMIDFAATHCILLPTSVFQEPESLHY
ncbi:phosphatidylserine lipase ABHD16A-like isoform X1 [Octopus sinensis]|uniref:Phosphatidylserine lipase ABHD16A-like isoform X1 n=2 Tax=Octopus sinensis TaxID=2607531 RepID=A0A7E6ESU6_9MOLL|nr:phosphatidylserine lipase ABHD16A-like isoform X1 [Octopus sinensis]